MWTCEWMRPPARGMESVGGVRAAIVALKPGNAGGAKGRRKSHADEKQNMEKQPSKVAARPKQHGPTIPADAPPVKVPTLWTERMLDALLSGRVKKWFSLNDKVASRRALEAGFARVKANRGAAGSDGVSVKRFAETLDKQLDKLLAELVDKTYCPRPIRRVHIPKPGGNATRPLGIPCVRDRVVQSALLLVIEPVFEATFADCSFGFRPKRSQKMALREVNRLLHEGYHHVVDADIRSYFDCIPHDRLMAKVREHIADGQVLRWLEAFLGQPVLEPDGSLVTNTKGIPQGSVIGPLLANLYLDATDHSLEAVDLKVIRYADDLVILCRSRTDAQQALGQLRSLVEQEGLELHPEKTRLADLSEPGGSFVFLGYVFKRTQKDGRLVHLPSTKSAKGLRERLKPFLRKCNGQSLEAIIRRLNPILRGWFQYFKHSSWSLETYDGWVRMRLRTILRKRHKGKGRGRGLDHFRWPNKFFHKAGLFCMATAQAEMSQSVHR